MTKYNCKTFNKIADKGIQILEESDISINSDSDPNVILLREVQNLLDF